MGTFFALLYFVAFIVFLVFLIKTIMAKKKGGNISLFRKIWIASFIVFIVSFIITGILNPRSDESEKKEAKDSVEIKEEQPETTVDEPQQASETPEEDTIDISQDTVEEKATVTETPSVKEDQEASINNQKEASTENPKEVSVIEENPRQHLDEFFSKYIENGRVDTIGDIAEECGVFVDEHHSGAGVEYKIANTKEDARVISLSDLTKGDYCIVIKGNGETITGFSRVFRYVENTSSLIKHRG